MYDTNPDISHYGAFSMHILSLLASDGLVYLYKMEFFAPIMCNQILYFTVLQVMIVYIKVCGCTHIIQCFTLMIPRQQLNV